MITQHQIDTITENLASELHLTHYNHLELTIIVRQQLHFLLDDLTRYPSRYFQIEAQGKNLISSNHY